MGPPLAQVTRRALLLAENSGLARLVAYTAVFVFGVNPHLAVLDEATVLTHGDVASSFSCSRVAADAVLVVIPKLPAPLFSAFIHYCGLEAPGQNKLRGFDAQRDVVQFLPVTVGARPVNPLDR